jgi:hypothetical protein
MMKKRLERLGAAKGEGDLADGRPSRSVLTSTPVAAPPAVVPSPAPTAPAQPLPKLYDSSAKVPKPSPQADISSQSDRAGKRDVVPAAPPSQSAPACPAATVTETATVETPVEAPVDAAVTTKPSGIDAGIASVVSASPSEPQAKREVVSAPSKPSPQLSAAKPPATPVKSAATSSSAPQSQPKPPLTPAVMLKRLFLLSFDPTTARSTSVNSVNYFASVMDVLGPEPTLSLANFDEVDSVLYLSSTDVDMGYSMCRC